MYAVIRTGGKQHRVRENDRIVVERLAGAPGDVIALSDVLLLGGHGTPAAGGAVPAQARVFAEVLEQRQGRKVLVFKKKRRKNHRRLKGHRQLETVVRIAGISPSGEPPSAGQQAAAEPLAPAAQSAPEAREPASDAAAKDTSAVSAPAEPVKEETKE